VYRCPVYLFLSPQNMAKKCLNHGLLSPYKLAFESLTLVRL
jgi:hypothetical protein